MNDESERMLSIHCLIICLLTFNFVGIDMSSNHMAHGLAVVAVRGACF